MPDCKHSQWDFQGDHSTQNVRRYRCASCGCWGFRMPFQKAINKKQVGLQPYSHNGGPLLEPLEEWHISKRLDPTVYQNMTMRERKESADV